MKKFLLLILMLLMQASYAHHNQDHIVIEIDPNLSPPDNNSYLWIIFGPLLILLVFGLIKAIQRYRREK